MCGVQGLLQPQAQSLAAVSWPGAGKRGLGEDAGWGHVFQARKTQTKWPRRGQVLDAPALLSVQVMTRHCPARQAGFPVGASLRDVMSHAPVPVGHQLSPPAPPGEVRWCPSRLLLPTHWPPEPSCSSCSHFGPSRTPVGAPARGASRAAAAPEQLALRPHRCWAPTLPRAGGDQTLFLGLRVLSATPLTGSALHRLGLKLPRKQMPRIAHRSGSSLPGW